MSHMVVKIHNFQQQSQMPQTQINMITSIEVLWQQLHYLY